MATKILRTVSSELKNGVLSTLVEFEITHICGHTEVHTIDVDARGYEADLSMYEQLPCWSCSNAHDEEVMSRHTEY
jgi:hypothetical protein